MDVNNNSNDNVNSDEDEEVPLLPPLLQLPQITSHWQPTTQMTANNLGLSSPINDPLIKADLHLLRELEILKERVKKLKDKLNEPTIENSTVSTNDTGIAGLNAEQNIAVSMIMTNPSIGWTVALQRLLMVVFGEETLAESCCKEERIPPSSLWTKHS